ncbi:MAG: protein-disulfide reductase DsbD domain-containing protein, partial [Acidobacteriota bacterium]
TSTSGSEAAARAALDQLATRFDAEYGGFGEQPKFPTPSNLALLAHFAGDPAADRMLGTTLDRMARGGLYDQVGGGFHRYATDRAWRVPHFEKMLYDNGALLELYADWHTRHEDAQSARVLRQTAAFLAREMTSPDGGLYSAIDAETDAREGAFYIWRPDALRAALDADEHAWAASILGFDEPPSFRDPHATDEPPTYILHLPRPLAEVAGDAPVKAIERRLDAIRTTLLATRSERPRPLTDDKVLTDWNGLAIAGLADAGRVLGDATMVGQAERAARFVLDHLRPEGRPLQHVWRRGEARIDAFLADYAYLVHGLLALDRATGDARWLRVAIQLTDEQVTRLWDAEGGGFYVATVDPDLLARSKDPSDGARPSANGIALSNLLTLADRTGDARWSSYAVGIVSAFSRELAEMPAGHTTLARGVARLASRSPTSAIDRLRAESRSKVAAVARWTGAGDLAVELSVADGWHVNANPASDELFVPTTLTGDAPTLVEIDYPEGRRFDASYADTPILVYSGSVVLNADVRAPTAGTVRLRVQPCDAQRCLEPVTLDVVVPAP